MFPSPKSAYPINGSRILKLSIDAPEIIDRFLNEEILIALRLMIQPISNTDATKRYTQ
jgi:hypothetical protein